MNEESTLQAPSAAAADWHGELSLRYERRGPRTVLAQRSHRGPLVVQKALYPEGDAVCQGIVVHPPAGMVGGDRLTLKVAVEPAAHAQLTTPGAAKWYRSQGASAQQSLTFTLASKSTLEWLPQETIYYPDGAVAVLDTRVHLASRRAFFGWELHCLGCRRLLPRAITAPCTPAARAVGSVSNRCCSSALLLEGESLSARWGLADVPAFGTCLVYRCPIGPMLCVRAGAAGLNCA